MKLRNAFTSASSKVENLRVVVSRIRYSKTLDSIPDALARVIDLHDRAQLDMNFRQDIHSILAGGVNVAESMLDPAFDSNKAISMVSEQITTLSRILNYLSQRPARIGYSILSVPSGTLLGQFSSEGEARQHLDDLRSFGHAANAIVVPVKIISQFSIQPSAPAPEGFPSCLSSPTPTKISELDDMIYEHAPQPESELAQLDDPALPAPAAEPNKAPTDAPTSSTIPTSTFKPQSSRT